MPKAFTEQEKTAIREKLFEGGKALVAQYGIRKTSVQDLANAAGISKGAFYIFYDSKEELFMEIFERIELEIRDVLWKGMMAGGGSHREQFKRTLQAMFEKVRDTPMMTHFSAEDLHYLARKLPEERLAHHVRSDEATLEHFLAHLRRTDSLREDADGTVAAGMLRALILLDFQKEEVGPEVHDTVIGLFMDALANYLIKA